MDQTIVAFPSSMLDTEQPRIEPQDYLDPVEIAIARSFLSKSADAGHAPPERWFADDQPDGQGTHGQHVRLQRLSHSEMTDIAVRNAVARMCLNAVQARLPQWGLVDRDGKVALARHHDPRRVATVELAPHHLFTLNWADSGPGLSWPEAYHATYLPGFDRWVVTMSVDSTDVWGCTDIALGSFRPGAEIVRASGRIIIRYWRKYQCYDPDTGGWAYLFGTGLVSQATAYRWRRRVWWSAEKHPRAAWL